MFRARASSVATVDLPLQETPQTPTTCGRLVVDTTYRRPSRCRAQNQAAPPSRLQSAWPLAPASTSVKWAELA